MHVIDDCGPLILGKNECSLERETAVLFEVHTCSRVRVQLKNDLIQPVYQFEFANSDAEVNTIGIVAKGETTSENAQFSQDCAKTRQFWMSWKDGVISAEIGLSPGTMVEVIRLADRRESSNKAISMARMTTLTISRYFVVSFFSSMNKMHGILLRTHC